MKIQFLDGTANYNPHRLEVRPTGGIMTSLTILPRLLSQYYGHECNVVSWYEIEEFYEGVSYSFGQSGLQKADITICNRNLINRGILHTLAMPVIWWLHDIVQFSYLEDSAYKEVHKIVALSDYCKRSYADFYDISEDVFAIIPNGVDRSIFFQDRRERNRNLWVIASAPIKGLSGIGFIYEQLKRHNPELEMRVYSSQSLHDEKNTEEQQKHLSHLQGIGVIVTEPVPQAELAEVFRSAYALIMPNTYPEICSNLLLQARACGLPVVASSIGSVPEFITHGETGLLTHTAPHDMFWFWKDLTELCVKLHLDHKLHRKLSVNAPWGVLDWHLVAQQWNKLISEVLIRRAA